MSLGKTLIDKALETRTVYRLSVEIDEPRETLSKMHKGSRPVPTRVAAKMAKLLEIDPAKAALENAADQEPTPEGRALLRQLFRLASAGATAAILAGIALVSPTDSHANQQLTSDSASGSVYYVKSHISQPHRRA